MNYELILRNIRASWRNLMKCKTQNIISVLCLAVGLVLFSATFIITKRSWQLWQRNGGDPRRAHISLSTQTERDHAIAPEDIQRIYNANLSSIEFIDLDYGAVGIIALFTDLEGRVHEVDTRWKWISPERLNYLGQRSDITGKRIPIQKPGDVPPPQALPLPAPRRGHHHRHGHTLAAQRQLCRPHRQPLRRASRGADGAVALHCLPQGDMHSTLECKS